MHSIVRCRPVLARAADPGSLRAFEHESIGRIASAVVGSLVFLQVFPEAVPQASRCDFPNPLCECQEADLLSHCCQSVQVRVLHFVSHGPKTKDIA
jgi:hypothetical protein